MTTNTLSVYDNVLSNEQIQKFRKEEERMKKLIIAGVSTGTLLVTSLVAQVGKSDSPIPQNKKVHEVVKEKTVKPQTLIASEVVYSSESEYGKELLTKSGKAAVGTLTKEEHLAVYETFLRIVSPKSIEQVKTADVVTEDGKETFNPYVTYTVSDGGKVFVPGDGVIQDINKGVVVIKHLINKVSYFSIVEGIDTSLEKGKKVNKGELLGDATGEVKYAIAKNYKAGEFFEFVHPNRFVSIGKSDAHRYESSEYYSKPDVSISPEAGKKVEKEFEKIPEEVKSSKVLKGVEVQNKEQLAVLKSYNKYFYYNGVLPMEFLENGKALVSPQVRELEPLVREVAQEYKIEEMTEFLLALLQQESGGNKTVLATDPFQASQSKSGKINSITVQKESIEQGVKKFVSALTVNGMYDPVTHADVRLAVQSYNFGDGLGRDAKKEGVDYNIAYIQEKAAEYRANALARGLELSEVKGENGEDWRGDAQYGDFTYVAKIFNFYEPSSDWQERATNAEKEVREISALEEIENAKKKAKAQTQSQTEVKEANKENPEVTKEKVVSKNPYRPGLTAEEVALIDKTVALYSDKIKAIDNLKVNFASLSKSDALKGKIIVLDAGHGAKDIGATGYDGVTQEKTIVIQVVLKLKASLEDQGAKVLLTRWSDEGFMGIDERAAFIKNNKANLAISVHANSENMYDPNTGLIKPKLASGVETLYWTNSAEGQKFASAVQSNMKEALSYIDDRKTKARNNLGVLKTSVPTALIELGFMSHPYDYHLIKNDNVQQSIVNALTKSSLDYLGVNSNLENTENVTPEKENTEEKTQVPENKESEPKEEVVEEKTKEGEKENTESEEVNKADDSEVKENKETEDEKTETKTSESDTKEDSKEKSNDEAEKVTDEEDNAFLINLFKKDKSDKEEKESPETKKELGEEKNETKVSQLSDDELFIWSLINKRA